MSADKKRVSLATDIARVLGRKKLPAEFSGTGSLSSRCLLMTGVALAVMQSQPARAVSLGDLRVQSGLGQPLVASTTARLGPGEMIAANCVSTPAAKGDGLKSPKGLKVSAQSGTTPGNYPIQIRSTQPLYEPMYEIRLQVDCPGGIALSKSYVVMLNLPMAAPVEQTATQSGRPAADRNSANDRQQGRNTPAPARNSSRLAPSRAGIAAGERYRVRNGDTLSVIAERVEGRPVGSTWRVADMLFAANPRAFIRGNRDMIKLGAVLEIPSLEELNGTAAPTVVAQDSDAPLASALSANDSAGISGSKQVNVTLGRPEEDGVADVSNAELLREIREANLAQEATAPAATDSPFADETDTASAVTDGAADTNAVAANESAETMPTAAPEPQPAGLSSWVAALAGIFMGILLALAMLGRNILGPLLDGRARRKAAQAAVPAAVAAQPEATEFKPVRPAYGGGGIDVEIGSNDQPDTTVDVDLTATQGDAPRVSLHAGDDTESESASFDSLLEGLDEAENDSDKTARFEAPRLNTPLGATAEHAGESMDNTGTMRSLFDETAEIPASTDETVDMDNGAATVEMPDGFDSATAELPAVALDMESDMDADDAADIDITDLESLSRRLQDTQDDKLSATLTQALGLLEQDYEDEMTASQILEQQEVDKAFSQHKAKD